MLTAWSRRPLAVFQHAARGGRSLPSGFRQVFRRPAHGGRLLPAAFGPIAGAVVVACITVIALLGALVAGQSGPVWLDKALDTRIQSALASLRGLLSIVAHLGGPIPVAVMTAAVALACLATRRVRGALLAVLAVPAAAGTSEVVLKPLVDRTQSGFLCFPSGHTTGACSVAAVVAVLLIGPQHPALPARLRALLACAGAVLAAAVAIALVGLSKHYVTDTVAGAAVAIGAVLVTALIIDRLAGRPASRTVARRQAPASGQSEARQT